MVDMNEKMLISSENLKTEKLIAMLNEFFSRNKEYGIEIYLKNGITDSIIQRLYIPTGRTISYGKNDYKVMWSDKMSEISIPYDDVISCHEEKDEYNQQSITVILKGGLFIEIECVGL